MDCASPWLLHRISFGRMRLRTLGAKVPTVPGKQRLHEIILGQKGNRPESTAGTPPPTGIPDTSPSA